jgi:hypothetical protein
MDLAPQASGKSRPMFTGVQSLRKRYKSHGHRMFPGIAADLFVVLAFKAQCYTYTAKNVLTVRINKQSRVRNVFARSNILYLPFFVAVLFCVALRRGWSPWKGVLPTVCKIHSFRLILNGNKPKVPSVNGRRRSRRNKDYTRNDETFRLIFKGPYSCINGLWGSNVRRA